MDNATRIAVSGLGAATARLEAAASNIANMRNSGKLPGTPPGQDVPQAPGNVYQAQQVQQTATRDGGVSASLQTVLPSYRVAFDPGAPFADGQGLVAAPNVDIATEFVNLIQARAAFGASLAVIKAVDGNTRSLLKLIA